MFKVTLEIFIIIYDCFGVESRGRRMNEQKEPEVMTSVRIPKRGSSIRRSRVTRPTTFKRAIPVAIQHGAASRGTRTAGQF